MGFYSFGEGKMSETAKLIKGLTHNIALCDYRGLEIILFGKGIAFGKKKDDPILLLDAEKIYQINDIKQLNAYEDLVLRSDEEIIQISEDIISALVTRFGPKYDEKLHVTLLDHLVFTLKRMKHKVELNNLFIDETKYMYPEEYQFASEIVEMINKRLDIKLPESEASLITMHIHGARVGDLASVSTLIVGVVSTCVNLIEEEAQIKIPTDSFLRQRLVTHIKFAIKRSMDNISLHNPLVDVICEKYPEAYRIASKLSTQIEKEYGFSFTEGEKAYLSLHIENIMKESEENSYARKR